MSIHSALQPVPLEAVVVVVVVEVVVVVVEEEAGRSGRDGTPRGVHHPNGVNALHFTFRCA